MQELLLRKIMHLPENVTPLIRANRIIKIYQQQAQFISYSLREEVHHELYRLSIERKYCETNKTQFSLN